MKALWNDSRGYRALFYGFLQPIGEQPLFGEACSVGLMGALELMADKSTRRFFDNRGDTGAMCRDFALACGLILRATKDTMLFWPPLVIGRAHIDEMIELTLRSLDQAAEALGVV